MTTAKGAMAWLTATTMQQIRAVEALLRAAYAQQEDGEGNVVAILADLRKVCAARGYDWERVVRKSAKVWAEVERVEGQREKGDTEQ